MDNPFPSNVFPESSEEDFLVLALVVSCTSSIRNIKDGIDETLYDMLICDVIGQQQCKSIGDLRTKKVWNSFTWY